MKLHPEFGLNAISRVCLCCNKTIGYTPLGDTIKDDARNDIQCCQAIVCEDCKNKLETQTCFVGCDFDNKGNITYKYDTLWIDNKGLNEFFNDTEIVNPVNVMPKEHFYNIFGNVIKDLYKEYEDNRTES